MAAATPFPVVPRPTALTRHAGPPRPAPGLPLRFLPPRRVGTVATLYWSPEAELARRNLDALRTAALTRAAARRRPLRVSARAALLLVPPLVTAALVGGVVLVIRALGA